MSTTLTEDIKKEPLNPPETTQTAADLIRQLGGIPLERIRIRPPIGTATEQDVIDIEAYENRFFELLDGVLVEKAMGFRESMLAAVIIRFLGNFVADRNLGLVTGSDGMMRLAPGLVRYPDVAFISWATLKGRVPTVPVPDVAPDLAIEVLSASNTDAEMQRKLREFFGAGTRLAWLIDPETRTAAVYTTPGQMVLLTEAGTLDGGSVLPGFTLPLKQLFAELDRSGAVEIK